MVAIIFGLIAGLWTAQAASQSCVSAGHWQSTDDENGYPSHHVWVYIDASLANDLRATTNDPYDGALAFPQVRAAVMQAGEIWNNETRGYRFLYAGAVSVDDVGDFCAATTMRPAVFVHVSAL